VQVLTVMQPKGMYAGYVRNLGVNASSGEYIAFLDADDAFLPEKLSKHLQYAQLLDSSDLTASESYIASHCRSNPRTGVFSPWIMADVTHMEKFKLYNGEYYKNTLGKLARKSRMVKDGASLPSLWDIHFLE
jgi:glycosyltransferase involved in cell wall biosynthesis